MFQLQLVLLSFVFSILYYVFVLYYLRQVNKVNGRDNAHIRCVSVFLSVCLCVRSGPVNLASLKSTQIAPKRLKVRTSNLSGMFPGSVGHDPLFVWKRGVCKNSLGRDMQSHERLLGFHYFLSFISHFCRVCFYPY